MIWICLILYILIASLVTFALRVACIKWKIQDTWGDEPAIAPIVCGILWPVATPIYTAYIAAKRYADNHDAERR